MLASTISLAAGLTKPCATLQVAGVEVGNESYLVVCEYSPAGNVNTPQVKPAFDLSQARRCLQATVESPV